MILASSSVVRAKLLKDFGVQFIQKPIDFDEDSLQTQDPKEFVYLAAMGKFQAALKQWGTQEPILAADTVVDVSGALQRKPSTQAQAQEFLKAQSGKHIQILTCIIYRSAKLEFIDIAATKYVLKTFAPKDTEQYLLSGDWRNKAGGVMVEGFHKSYIKSQIGLESTALGLSVEKILPFLEII
ncbi:septum formation inhibitor Maf [Helicobacter sp. 12S02634-8]|uniref:septum formation inhibitor Maf n=1 Tax=Helicobacter sp. 12S02634-8 TaxID=1476199 RepID=UPI000BA5E7E6|nr:septum formation inhibitor Maf [Helicobacter sp. 12S02634-8]